MQKWTKKFPYISVALACCVLFVFVVVNYKIEKNKQIVEVFDNNPITTGIK